jgi:putative Ca2+/H+ antiporter (TMEM165/GDT1 family)
MAALLASFVAAFLCAWGDRTQLIASTLAAQTKRPGMVLAGLILAAIASNVVAAFAGIWIAATINIRAMTLLTALALLSAGLFGLFPRRQKPETAPRFLLPAAFILCLAAEVGDRIQFLVFAFAGRFDSAPLAAAGGAAGLVAACMPAILLGETLPSKVPVRAIRWGAAAVMLIAGFITAVNALQLT